MMARVRLPWDEIAESPKKAEQLFDLVLHAVYGNRVSTVNGAGGDGGVDAWIEDIRRAVEFKSFTRLGGPQRTQVRRSLERAAELAPDSWVLVAPVHPTPGDLQWFASLAGRHPFEVVFHDVRWLESRLAERPDIARYVLTTPHREVVDLLRDLNQEGAALLGGAPDLQARLRALRGRVDELSPVWGLDFASRSGQQAMAVYPKPGSPSQHLVVHLDIPADDPQGAETTARVTAAVEYGTGAVVEPGFISRVDNDALAELNLPWKQMALVLPDQRVTEGFPRAAVLRARAADGRLGRPLHLTLHHATVGGRGMDVHGTDTTGMLRTRLRVDRPDSATPERGVSVGMQLQYGPRDRDHAASADPDTLLRTLEVLDELDRTTGMTLAFAGAVEPIALEVPGRRPTGHFTPLAQALRDVVLLRDELGVLLTLPAAWSAPDRRNLAVLAGLLRDEEVPMPVASVTCHQISTATEATAFRDLIEAGARLDFQLVGLSLTVAGVAIPVDPLYVAFSEAEILNSDEVAHALTGGDQLVPVEIGPAPGSTVLGRRTPFPGPEAPEPAPG